jgi:hypothetical protein
MVKETKSGNFFCPPSQETPFSVTNEDDITDLPALEFFVCSDPFETFATVVLLPFEYVLRLILGDIVKGVVDGDI